MDAPDEPLPVVVVSAGDLEAATLIISELVEEEGEEVTGEGAGLQGARVWRLNNKYYCARALVCALPDRAAPRADLCARAHAHVVLLAPHEVCGAALRARAAVLSAAPHLAVRLALAQRAAPALRAAAAALRYELVPLRAPDDGGESDDDSDGDEPTGVARARAALHAHTWPNLRLHARTAPSTGVFPEGWGAGDELDEGGEEAALERAELFAEALGALGAMGGGGGGVGGGEGEESAEGRAARVARAEALVGAFCAALGAPPRRL